jgi:hypothetical protein
MLLPLLFQGCGKVGTTSDEKSLRIKKFFIAADEEHPESPHIEKVCIGFFDDIFYNDVVCCCIARMWRMWRRIV